MNETQTAPANAATSSCHLYLTFSTEPQAARVAGQCVNNVVSTVMSVEDTAAVELCVVEAINNIVEHGYADNPNAVIDVELTVFDEKIDVLIRDDGNVIPVSAFAQADSFKFNKEDILALPEGGMGLFLMINCMDELSYATDARKRNCLYMTRYFHA